MSWKTIKIHERDYKAVMEIRQQILAHGSQHLPPAAQEELREGTSIRAIMGAGLALLGAAVGPPAPAPPRPDRPPRRRP